MPNLNRKGPEGAGALTGRKLGKCNPENRGKTDEEIIQNRISVAAPTHGLGRGLVKGMGRGWRHGFGQGGGHGLGRSSSND